MATQLSPADLALLAVEGRRWTTRTVKEQAIADTLGLSVTQYYLRLDALLDDPAALAHDPLLVNRLRRRRNRRRVTSDGE